MIGGAVSDPPSAPPVLPCSCAWCGKVLKKGPPPISHGMCADCAHGWADS